MRASIIIAFLTTTTTVISRIRGDELYEQYRFEDVCPTNGGKREISLRNGAGVFRLKVPSVPTPFTCHLELEVSRGFGLHVYIDEMNFVGSEGTGCSGDYIQFGRDVLYFTTYRSPKYCGIRSKLNFTADSTYRHLVRGATRPRLYIEEKDSEMDVWLRLGGRLSSVSPGNPRNLTMTVTAFKKNCGEKDLYYQRCRHTNHCVRRKFFCDGRPNCAWPSGEVASDEKYCREGRYIGHSAWSQDHARPGGLNAYNIPIIIIIIIVVLAIIIVATVGFGHSFRQRFRPETPPPQNPRRISSNRVSDFRDATPPLLSGTTMDLTPSAPPSYEEVISNNSVPFVIHTDDPPPYSTSIK